MLTKVADSADLWSQDYLFSERPNVKRVQVMSIKCIQNTYYLGDNTMKLFERVEVSAFAEFKSK